MRPQPKTQEEAGRSPRADLLAMIRGYRVSQMLVVAAKLRIADLLAGGPRSVAELARSAGCHEDSLYRVLRALASIGIFAELEDRSFRLTPTAEFLRGDVPGSLRANAQASGEDWMWGAWGALLHSVKTGEAACEHVFGMDSWKWFKEHPEDGVLFDECMDETTGGDVAAIVAAYDFAQVGSIVDIAGGRGVLLAEILRQAPAARGVLFNLPQVIEGARQVLSPEIARRIEFVSGDFFQSVPAGGDRYILKNILHDWDDNDCVAILRSCRRAMANTARLLIVEFLVAAPNEGAAGKLGDVLMMVRTGGRNRTQAEFHELLNAGGFDLARVIPSKGGPELIEALPRN